MKLPKFIIDLLKKRVLERFTRVFGASTVPAAILSLIENGTINLDTLLATVSGNPWIIAATPLIAAVFKELRMRHPKNKLLKYLVPL